MVTSQVALPATKATVINVFVSPKMQEYSSSRWRSIFVNVSFEVIYYYLTVLSLHLIFFQLTLCVVYSLSPSIELLRFHRFTGSSSTHRHVSAGTSTFLLQSPRLQVRQRHAAFCGCLPVFERDQWSPLYWDLPGFGIYGKRITRLVA